MAFTLNRRLSQLVDSSGQLNTGKIPNDYITSDHVADNTITTAMLHSGFTLPTSSLSSIDTDNVSEGSSNLYYTDARVDARLLGNTITSNHGIVADNDGNKVELTTGGSIEITRTAGSPFIDFKDSTSEDFDQRIQVISGNFNFTADGLSISGSEFIDSSRNINIGSGTISSGNITTTGYIAGPATFTIDPAAVGDNTGTVVIAGNLQVDGTTTTINSTTMTVDDLNITLASGAANAAAANGAGLTVDGASATITYDGTNDEWDFNKKINVTGTITASGNITGTLATAAQPNITSLGTLTSLNTSGSVTMDTSVASGNFLTDATIYPLRLTNDNTTAGNAVALTFGQGGFDFTNFIASVRTGTGDNPKGDLVFGGRPSDGSAFLERMRIQANGHVGIGTIGPVNKLDVRGGNIMVGGFNGGNDYGMLFTPADASSYWHIYNDAGGELVFGRNATIGSTEFARFDSTGKLGLGVNNPQYQLDISDTISSKIQLSGGTNQNGIRFAAAGDGGVSSSLYYLGVGSDLMSSTDYGAVLLDVTNNRSVLLDDQSNSRLGFYNNSMIINSSGNVGIGTTNPSKPLHIYSASDTAIRLQNSTTGTGTTDGLLLEQSGSDSLLVNYEAGNMRFFTSNSERMRIGSDGYITFTSTRNEYSMELNSAGTRSGLVLKTPGTNTITGSALLLSSDVSYRLGTQSYYHIKMLQDGTTWFGNNTNYSKFDVNGNLNIEHGGVINFEAADNDYSTVYTATGYTSESYSDTNQRYWNHLISKGGTHITINSDGGHTASENNYDDFVIWQGTQDIAEPLFRVSNTGRVIAKQNYEIGNHKTNREPFGVSAINTIDEATNNINTTTDSYEKRSGVYWLNFNSKKFRAFVRPDWMQGRNWVLAAKFFAYNDMPSGSTLWTNDSSWNGGDFDLNNGHFSKYGNVWRYFSFNRLAMQMGNRVAPIMQFTSNQTLYGAFSGGRAANGGGVTANSTDPSLGTGTSVTYHSMTNYMGPNFTDLAGAEDRLGSYGLNKWANNASNSTSANNNGSANLNSNTSKGFQFTVEDNHPHIAAVDSIGYAGAWIGCPLDEGASTQTANSSNGGADSGFGLGGGCGNTARTWTSGVGEWINGNQVANYLPAYIWLSID